MNSQRPINARGQGRPGRRQHAKETHGGSTVALYGEASSYSQYWVRFAHSIHKHELVAIHNQPTKIGHSVLLRVNHEVGRLLARWRTTKRQFAREPDPLLLGVRERFHSLREMLRKVGHERAVP